MFISVDQLEESAKRYASLEKKPRRDAVPPFTEEVHVPDVSPEVTRGNILSAAENLIKRKEMLRALRKEPTDFAFERAMGNNDSVYSNFVELIVNAKRKVGRIAIKQGNRNIGFATGFMVSKNLLLTNWHVFKVIEEVGDSEVQFFYELDVLGNPGKPVSFRLQSEIFFHSNRELDYCFIAVSPTDLTGESSLGGISYLYLNPALGKLGNEEEEALNIIHHPDGDYKQLSIRENLFIKISPTSIWYQTDTAPGSSGSPVFNDQWQVVALHHMGVGKKNANGEYIDKNGDVIPEKNGKIDASKIVWIANEGIRISVILKDIFLNFPNHQLVTDLKKRPDDGLSAADEANADDQISDLTASKKSDMEPNNADNNINISIPASLIESKGAININITTRDLQDLGAKTVEKASQISAADLDFAEIKKLETSADYSTCKGYQSGFLGRHRSIPLPQPTTSRLAAKVSNTDSIVLRYFNYSVIFHSVRMMPLISAVNIDGNPEKRKDDSARKDVWLRDTRLSFDIQLDDSYYRNSGFDRGHMSRREDANWGNTAEDAKRNADFTCMYTNACPQVAKINQSTKKGLWGILEKVVLESGAELEAGKTSKISVFNGPVFRDDDPVYKGIQVPLNFFKIITWLTDDGALKATAFKLSQTELVGDIDFEQLDIDQNVEFKEFQCSIKSLQEETKLDFSRLVPFDTFEGNEGEEIALNSAAELVTHITRHNKE